VVFLFWKKVCDARVFGVVDEEEDARGEKYLESQKIAKKRFRRAPRVDDDD
jgi:hypothetical protein